MYLRATSARVLLAAVLACGAVSATRGQSPAADRAAADKRADTATTQPAPVSVRGTVTLRAQWSFQKPDLARTVLYLASAPALDKDPGPQPMAVVAQHGKAFEPNFIAIPAGTRVEFPNWDHFDHNVFSRSSAGPAFDLLRYHYGQSKSRTFTHAGVIQLFCNIHPEMHALIFVTPNRFLTRADSAGHFELRGVPAGTYTLIAWNERCRTAQASITVAPGQVPDVALTLAEDRASIMTNDAGSDDSYTTDRGLSVTHETLDLPCVKDCHPSPVPAPRN